MPKTTDKDGPNPLVIFLTVDAKMESAVAGGSYFLHCSFTTEVEGVMSTDDPMQLAVKVGTELFNIVELGDVIAFPLDPHIQRPSLAENN